MAINISSTLTASQLNPEISQFIIMYVKTIINHVIRASIIRFLHANIYKWIR